MHDLDRSIRLGVSDELADFVDAFGEYHHRRMDPEGPTLLQRAHWAYDRLVRAHADAEAAVDAFQEGDR